MVMNQNVDTPNEADDLNQHMERVNTASSSHARGAQYTGVLKLAALCLGLMCVLQATLNIALRLHTHHQAARDQLQGSCINLTLEGDQLQTRYNNLNTEKDQLQTRYNNLNTEKDQLQTSYNNLNTQKDQLQTRYNKLNTEKDQLQTQYNNLNAEKEQLQKKRDGLRQQLLQLKQGRIQWTFFAFSMYYISTKRKNWYEARQFCKERNTDLVIINHREEEEFIHTLSGGKEAWIGLTDRTKEGDWKWVDGTALHTRYWEDRGRPNSNTEDEDCAITVLGSNRFLHWADYPCTDQFVWICEKQIL